MPLLPLVAKIHETSIGLCRETHNNISALMSRHMEQDGDGIAYVMNKAEDSHALPDSFAALLIGAGVLVHDWAETGHSSEFYPLSDQLHEIRCALGAHINLAR
jgi:hypothetical protein